jgi:hypothetical protein
LEILKKREVVEKTKRDPVAYFVNIIDGLYFIKNKYLILKGRFKTTVIDLFDLSINWESPDYTSSQLKKDIKYKNARLSYTQISLEEFYFHLFEILNYNSQTKLSN